MKGAEQCGYVIRYGSFRAMVFPDVRGNSRGPYESLFINTRKNRWPAIENIQLQDWTGLNSQEQVSATVNRARARHETQ